MKLAFVSTKGGTGKTTSAVSLAMHVGQMPCEKSVPVVVWMYSSIWCQ